MPNWNGLLNELKEDGSVHDVLRRKYLNKLFEVTKRNTIVYYSGWLQTPGTPGMEINDEDKNGFMTVVHRMDRTKGLDLLLHTPGGDVAATESLVDYLRSLFGTDIRAIVPQLALSGGTMISCACKEIVMGKQSSLGPIDPQFRGIAAHGILEEFERAKREVKKDSSTVHIWQPIIASYNPTLIGDCEKAIAWSTEMTKEWLKSGMFQGEKRPGAKINRILKELGDHAVTKSHARHFSMESCQKMGLNVVSLEEDDELQEAVLSVHHACSLTLAGHSVIKLIENHEGTAFIKIVPQ